MAYLKRIPVLILVAISVALINTTRADVLVNENFDDGRYADTSWSVWLQNTNCATGSTLNVSPSAAYSGTNGLDIHYVIQDNPRGDCQLHQDNNTSLVQNISPPQSHYFIRGYFRFPFDDVKMCSSPTIQRKLIYFKPTNWGNGAWAFFINSWPWANCATDGYYLSVGYQNAGGTGSTLWGDQSSAGFTVANNHLHGNKWYYIEAEVQYGTYGNDVLRIWLSEAGTPPKVVLERTNLNLRSSSDAASGLALGSIELGRQVDLTRPDFSIGADEHRYWDEIVIGTTRIGPISSTAPYPPATVR